MGTELKMEKKTHIWSGIFAYIVFPTGLVPEYPAALDNLKL